MNGLMKKNYKWKIGIEILAALEIQADSFSSPPLLHRNNGSMMLFGIEVEKDGVYLSSVELWHNITDEL